MIIKRKKPQTYITKTQKSSQINFASNSHSLLLCFSPAPTPLSLYWLAGNRPLLAVHRRLESRPRQPSHCRPCSVHFEPPKSHSPPVLSCKSSPVAGSSTVYHPTEVSPVTLSRPKPPVTTTPPSLLLVQASKPSGKVKP